MGRKAAGPGLAALLAWAFTTAVLHAASFDCSRARSPVEHTICSSRELSEADGALGAAYHEALSALPPDGVSKLRVDQVRWLQWLQTGCDIPGTADPNAAAPRPSKRVPAPALKTSSLAACMLGPYRDRVGLLKHTVARVDGVLFLLRTMYLLQPNEEDDKTGAPTFPGYGEFEASWPEAQSADPQWTAWNAAVLQAAQKGASPSGTAAAWSAEMAAGLDATERLGLPDVRSGRAHLVMSYEAMGHGAAHPNEAFTKLTWLLADGRWLRASDVFRPGTPWQKALAEDCWRQLRAGENAANIYDTVKGPGDQAVLNVVSNVSNWTVTPRGLSISWPEYAITPRAFPLDDTVVPWKVLQPDMVPGFTP